MITEKQLEDILKEVFFNSQEDNNTIELGQYCLDKGFIFRTTLNANLCNNPKCSSCREYSKALDEAMEKLINELEDD